MDKTRLYALLILKEVLDGDRWSNKLIEKFRNYLPEEARHRFTELVMGSIKMKLRLDWTISQYLKGYTIDQLTPWIRNILRLGTYELIFMESIPPYATVKEAVALAKKFGHRGTAALVNAVLRRISGQVPIPEEPWLFHSHPEWLYRKWLSIYGAEKAVEIMKSNNRPRRFYIRVNTLRIKRDELIERLSQKGIQAEPLEFPPEGIVVTRNSSVIEEFRGLFTVQDLSSQIVSHLLAPQEGELIYDLGAAPGGKTTHIAELTGDRCRIIALEKHKSRLNQLVNRARELGIKSIMPVLGDILSPPLESMADKILLDVPCSGTGTLRRHPEIRWRLKPENLKELSEYQLALLRKAASLLRPGGVIVYSTCSMEPEENEEVIENFLRETPNFWLEDPRKYIPNTFVDRLFLKIDGSVHQSDWAFAARLVNKTS